MTGSRWLALDMLRCMAVLSMIQGHTFNELLAVSVKAQPWYHTHVRIHGLTAPTFLFAAGLAFGVTTFGRFADHASFGRAPLRRLRRYGFLIALAYTLQMPGLSWLEALLDGSVWSPAVVRIGPLHLVGATLLGCELLVLATKNRRLCVVLAAMLGVAIALCARLVWRSELSRALPAVLAAWFDGYRGSLFPVFPWASFILAGVVAAHVLVRDGQPFAALRPLRAFAAIGGVGALLYGLGTLAWPDTVEPHETPYFWQTSPAYLLVRLGCVLLLLALACLAEAIVRKRLQRIRLPAVETLSRHSLLAYVSHLLLLYGTPFSPSLARRLGPTLGLPSAILAALALTLATLGIVYSWYAFRRAGGLRGLAALIRRRGIQRPTRAAVRDSACLPSGRSANSAHVRHPTED